MFAIIALIGIIGLLIYYKARDRNYWLNKGAAQKSKFSLGLGINMILKLKRGPDMIKDLYDEFQDKRYFGTYEFNSHVLVIRDLELIKQLGIKDFDHFMDHREFISPELDTLWSKNLLNLRGDKWRHMRATLSPSFTSSKMKAMFHLMKECGESFANYFVQNPDATKEVDMKDAFTRYSNDIIASLAFGIKCDSLTDRNNEFYMMGKDATNFTSFSKNIGFALTLINKNLAKLLKVTIFSKKCSNFFRNLIDETLKVRAENNIKRQDMLQLLIDSSKGKYQDEVEEDTTVNTGFATVEEHIKPVITTQTLTNEDITAQALIFFLGGFESVSHLMNFLSYELAVNPDIQQRLIEEIDETNDQCNGKLTYDILMKMKYLDMVMTETLRKYPTFMMLDRECVKPYTIEPENPDEKPIHLDTGDIIWFPVYGIQHDEKYYHNPNKFDPERFNEDNKNNINSYTYMPFGVGPRNCIGSRFALLETKILFFLLLTKFEFCVTDKTQIPLKFIKGIFSVAPERPITLQFKLRNKQNN